MKFLQRIKCIGCCHKARCDLNVALIKMFDDWEKTNRPRMEEALREADNLLERMNLET